MGAEIGLEAVFETGAFQKGLGKYLDGLSSATGKTNVFASLIGGTAKLVGGVLVAGIGAAAAAVGGMTAMVVASIGPASDLAETANKINVVFGKASEQINDFAKDAAKALGQSKQSALDAAATFGVFGKSAGLAGTELASFSIKMVNLASDLASFYNTSPEEAILAIGAALRGESEPIRRYGILLDDATLRQAALSLGLVKTTKEALTPAQRVLAAYAVILKQSSDAQGDFERTASGLANTQRIIAAQWANFKTTLGTSFLPFVQLGAQAVSNYLLPAITALADKLTPLGTKVEVFINKFKEVWDYFKKSNGEILKNAAFFEGIFGADLGGRIQVIASTLYDLFNTIKGGNITGFFNQLRNISPIFGMILGPVQKLAGYFQTLMNIFRTSGGDFGKIGQGLGQLVSTIINDLFSSKLNFAGIALQIITGLTAGLVAALPGLLPAVITLIQRLTDFIVQALPLLIQAAATILQTLVQGIITALPLLMQVGIQIIFTLINTIVPMLPMLIGTALQLVITLANGIALALPNLIPTIVLVMEKIILVLIQNLPMLIQAALNLIMALAQGLIAALPVLNQAVPTIVQAIADAIIVMLPLIGQTALKLLETLAKGIVSNLPKVGEAATKIVISIVDFIYRLWPTLVKIGYDIVRGIVEGIYNNAGYFYEQVKRFFMGMIIQVKKALHIFSPSQVFADIGVSIGEGLIQGMMKVQPDVLAAVESLIGNTSRLGTIISAFFTYAGVGKDSGLSEKLKEQMDAIEARAEEIRGGKHTLDLEIDKQQQIFDLYRERDILAKQYAEEQAKITKQQEEQLRLQQAQAKLNFLQSQLDMIKLLKEHGVDYKKIMAGMKLGLEANGEDLGTLMTKAMETMVEKINQALGIASPSKVFAQIGSRMAQGMEVGFKGASPLSGSGFTPATATINNYSNSFTFNNSLSNGFDLARLDAHILQVVRSAL